jgi:hypothetical protein
MTADLLPLRLLLLTLAGWVNRHQQHVIDYLVEENRVLRGQLRGRPPPAGRLAVDTHRRRRAVVTRNGRARRANAGSPPSGRAFDPRQRRLVKGQARLIPAIGSARRTEVDLRRRCRTSRKDEPESSEAVDVRERVHEGEQPIRPRPLPRRSAVVSSGCSTR